MNMFHMRELLRWALFIWLCLTAFVLGYGIYVGAHAGGGVAMQMFVLCFPSSLVVSGILNLLSYMPPSASPLMHILLVWAPFFVGGIFQAILVFVVFRWLVTRKVPKILSYESQPNPRFNTDRLRRPR